MQNRWLEGMHDYLANHWKIRKNAFKYASAAIMGFDACLVNRQAQIKWAKSSKQLGILEKSDATRYGEISEAAYLEQKQAIADIERVLTTLFGAQKINYMMLMMVDPNVHFHVIPRYPAPITFAGKSFTDAVWPMPPEMNSINEITPETRQTLLETLRANWPGNTLTA